MTISMHQASVGLFKPFLRNLSGLLDQAADHADARAIDPAILLAARLHPTMYDLRQQVGEAIRHAVIACALLAGVEPPGWPDHGPGFEGLKAQIADAIHFIEALPEEPIDGAADQPVVFRFRNGAEQTFSGRSLLLTFSVPQFFFHVTTVYDILRQGGVDLVKKDFLGTARTQPGRPAEPPG